MLPNPKDPNGEPEGLFNQPDALALSAPTAVLMKDIIMVLTRTYTGFRWAIQPDERGKVFNVFCLDFSARYGYVIRFIEVQDDPQRKEAIRAAGEILARFHYTGTRYDPELMAQVMRRPDGEAIPDLSDHHSAKERRRNALQRAYYESKLHIATIGEHAFLGIKR